MLLVSAIGEWALGFIIDEGVPSAGMSASSVSEVAVSCWLVFEKRRQGAYMQQSCAVSEGL